MNKEKLKYYQKLDKINKECNKEMIRLTFDTAFKSFFSRNPDYLKDFLIEELSLDMDKDETKITVSNACLPKYIQKEYQKKVDIIIYLDEVVRMNLEESILTEWEAKMLDEIEKYDTIKNSKEEGEYKNKIETARKMLEEKLEIELISKITGLSKDKIDSLK